MYLIKILLQVFQLQLHLVNYLAINTFYYIPSNTNPEIAG